ncbi:MAG: hypothetical protein KDA32_03455 [Phycisphaerales bacterium]|nr:hypothetical protein [Phycisphaerales bacterium]
MARKARNNAHAHLEPTAQRERLERYFRRERVEAPEMAPWVTGASHPDEPYHRWLRYRQAFAPQLVRHFLSSTGAGADSTPETPLLDPFSGSGTFAIECGRRGAHALGVEAIPVLAFLTRARGEAPLTRVPSLRGCATWRDVAERLERPLHQAALIFAVARGLTADGRIERAAPALPQRLRESLMMIEDDQRTPLQAPVRCEIGDARELTAIPDASISGLLTSPPYISRYDYRALTRAYGRVYRFWHGQADADDAQVRAQTDDEAPAFETAELDADESDDPLDNEDRHADDANGADFETGVATQGDSTAAIDEVCEALRLRNLTRNATLARAYFDDLTRALREMARVLTPGAPCWINVAGARLRGVHIPADLILTEIAIELGFTLEQLTLVRDVTPSRRRLGDSPAVAPRESIIQLRR